MSKEAVILKKVIKMMKKEIHGFLVEIEYKPIKHLYLKVKRDGNIVITAPTNMSMSKIEAFVSQKANWLEQKVKQQVKTTEMSTDQFLLFGQLIQVVELRAMTSRVYLMDQTLRIETPTRLTPQKRQHVIEQFCQSELEAQIQMYLKKYEGHIQSVPQSLTIKYRKMTATWGSCRPLRQSITFNKRLVHYRRPFIEYVVVHELCHFLYAHHQPSFYQYLETFLPNWKAQQRP